MSYSKMIRPNEKSEQLKAIKAPAQEIGQPVEIVNCSKSFKATFSHAKP